MPTLEPTLNEMRDQLASIGITIELHDVDGDKMWFARKKDDAGWSALVAGANSLTQLVEDVYTKFVRGA